MAFISCNERVPSDAARPNNLGSLELYIFGCQNQAPFVVCVRFAPVQKESSVEPNCMIKRNHRQQSMTVGLYPDDTITLLHYGPPMSLILDNCLVSCTQIKASASIRRAHVHSCFFPIFKLTMGGTGGFWKESE